MARRRFLFTLRGSEGRSHGPEEAPRRPARRPPAPLGRAPVLSRGAPRGARADGALPGGARDHRRRRRFFVEGFRRFSVLMGVVSRPGFPGAGAIVKR